MLARRSNLLEGLGEESTNMQRRPAMAIAAWANFWLPYASRLLEPWIRGKLLGVISEFVVPEVHIDRIVYSWPLKLEVYGVTMTAESPNGEGHVDILSVDHAEITLDEIPSSGPLIFRNFILESPQITLMVGDDGHIAGWDNFLDRLCYSCPKSGTRPDGLWWDPRRAARGRRCWAGGC